MSEISPANSQQGIRSKLVAQPRTRCLGCLQTLENATQSGTRSRILHESETSSSFLGPGRRRGRQDILLIFFVLVFLIFLALAVCRLDDAFGTTSLSADSASELDLVSSRSASSAHALVSFRKRGGSRREPSCISAKCSCRLATDQGLKMRVYLPVHPHVLPRLHTAPGWLLQKRVVVHHPVFLTHTRNSALP